MSKQVDLQSEPVRFKLGDYNAYYTCLHDQWGLENLYGCEGAEISVLAHRSSRGGAWKRQLGPAKPLVHVPTSAIVRAGAEKICHQEVVMILFQI